MTLLSENPDGGNQERGAAQPAQVEGKDHECCGVVANSEIQINL